MSFVSGTQAELLYAMPASGAAVIQTATSGTVSGGPLLGQGSSAAGAQQPYQLPAYFFPNTYGVGKSLLIQIGGTFLVGGTTETLKIGVYMNTTSGTPLNQMASTGAFSPTATVTGMWMVELWVTGTGILTGTTSTMNAMGRLLWGQGSSATLGTVAGAVYMMSSAAAVTFNNSLPYFIEPFASWTTSTSSNTLTMTNMYVWGMN